MLPKFKKSIVQEILDYSFFYYVMQILISFHIVDDY